MWTLHDAVTPRDDNSIGELPFHFAIVAPCDHFVGLWVADKQYLRLLNIEVHSVPIRSSGRRSSSSDREDKRGGDFRDAFRGGGHRCASAVWIDPAVVVGD